MSKTIGDVLGALRIGIFLSLIAFSLGSVFGLQEPVQQLQPSPQTQQKETESPSGETFWQRATTDPVAFFTLWLTVFTAVLAISTIGLWVVTWRASVAQARDMDRSIDLSERSLVSNRRAFVFASGLESRWIVERNVGRPDRYHWRLQVVWHNSGETPTKRLRQSTQCVLRDSLLGDNEVLPEGHLSPGSGLLGPKASSCGGLTPQLPNPALSPEDIALVIRGDKFLYIHGWIRYSDVFPGTPEHVTKFCWRVMPVGAPFDFLPDHPSGPHSLRFDYIHMDRGNCADEECDT